MKTKYIILFLTGLIYFSCADYSIEKKYSYWTLNNDFDGKNQLIKEIVSTINERLIDSLQYPKFYFLNNKFDWKLNENILINEKSNRAVIMIMSIGLDKTRDTLGSVNVVSAEYISDSWEISEKIDMTFYYFTHHYKEQLTFEKITELSTKRMIKAGYMKSDQMLNHRFVDENWNSLFGFGTK